MNERGNYEAERVALKDRDNFGKNRGERATLVYQEESNGNESEKEDRSYGTTRHE